MEHKGTVSLHTQRLLLRRLTPEDAEAMYRNWASDPEVTRYLTWPPHTAVQQTRALLEAWEAQYRDSTFYQWAIVPEDVGEPIGSISVVKWDEDTDTAEVGYCIGQKWWHRGYTSEALQAVMAFLFREVKIQRLEARHDTQNPHSGAVMQKCGMTQEGILRRAARNNRGIVDAAVYRMLATEYASRCAASVLGE